jgi:hypothetical protein
MSGPYIIRDLALLQSLNKTDAVVADPDYGVQCVGLVKYYAVNDEGRKCPATADWAAGPSVKSAIASCIAKAEEGIARGTAIATFKDGSIPTTLPVITPAFSSRPRRTGAVFLCLSSTLSRFRTKYRHA